MLAICIPRKELGSRAEARTIEIERALKMNASWILCLDLDQTIPLRGLNAMLAAGADVAVIDAPSKGRDDSNITYHPDGSVAVASISCCLIKAQIFKVLPKPWFSSKYDFRQDGTKNGKIVWNVQEKYKDDNRGEDTYFIRKVLDEGFSVVVVKNMKCQHYSLEQL